jgi:hypothetical protein
LQRAGAAIERQLDLDKRWLHSGTVLHQWLRPTLGSGEFVSALFNNCLGTGSIRICATAHVVAPFTMARARPIAVSKFN